MKSEPSPEDDILFGLAQCGKVLRDPKASAEERAVYLCWIVHLVGDLHQPLHTASLVNEDYPQGDKGGNAFYVRTRTKGINLHSFWDGLLGTSGKPQSRINYAVEIQSAYPRKSLPELSKDRTAKEWSLEGRSLAIEKVYLHGKLRGSTSSEDAPSLPDNYTKEAKAIAERQAALAGYRLADAITELFR